MSSENELTSRKRELLALAVAVGRTNQEAAAAVGVNEKTVRRALEDPDFREQVRLIQARAWDSVVGRMTDGLTEAVQTLRTLLGEGNPASARLGAARAILEHAPKLKETVEHERRISALEQKWEAEHAQSE